MKRVLSGAVLAALWVCIAGCSLLTIKSPEKPLSPRDLNARILTHDLAMHFNVSVEQAADQISAASAPGEAAVRLDALRWKIAASVASDKAAGQMGPMLGLLDEWALAVQMRDFLTEGGGKALFASGQPRAVAVAAALAGEAQEVARQVAGDDFERYRRFVDGYAHEHPIEDLNFARASIAVQWQRAEGSGAKLVDSLGTVPQAMAQASDLLRMYGDTMPSQALWRAQLAVEQSGVSSDDVQTALKHLDERMARLAKLADSTPDLVHDVVRDMRQQVDISWNEMIRTIHSERIDLTAAIDTERQATMDAVAVQRAAITADAQRVAVQVIRDAGEQARHLVRVTLLLLIVLAVVILGLPFTAGYLVGRVHRRSRETP